MRTASASRSERGSAPTCRALRETSSPRTLGLSPTARCRCGSRALAEHRHPRRRSFVPATAYSYSNKAANECQDVGALLFELWVRENGVMIGALPPRHASRRPLAL